MAKTKMKKKRHGIELTQAQIEISKQVHIRTQ